MNVHPPSAHVIAAIKADPGPIPDLKPPKQEITMELPEQAILGTVIFLAFAALIIGRLLHRPKVEPPLPPEHPAHALRRVLSQIVPNTPPAEAAAEMAAAYRSYLRTAFGLGEEQLTTVELSSRFGAHRLADAATAAKVQQMLREWEAVQFAPASEVEVEPMVERAWALLDELERQRTPSASMPPPLPLAT